MPSTYSLDDISDAEWDSFVMNSDYSGFMQSAAWARVKEVDGWSSIRVGVREKEKLQSAALVLSTKLGSSDKKIFYSPQGPVLKWHTANHAKGLKQLIQLVSGFAAEQGAICWRIEPWVLAAYGEGLHKYAKSPIDMQPRHTALVPLIKSEEEILEGFPSKVRYNIRLAQKRGVVVKSGNEPELFQDFITCYQKTTERKSLDTKDSAYFEAIQEQLGPKEQAFVVAAYKDSVPIAALLLIRFGTKLTYFFGGFEYEARRDMAPFLCHFEAIRLGKKLGCEFYDLWGIAGTENPDHPWHSFTTFKMGFSPLPITLAGAYDIVFDPGAYQELIGSAN